MQKCNVLKMLMPLFYFDLVFFSWQKNVVDCIYSERTMHDKMMYHTSRLLPCCLILASRNCRNKSRNFIVLDFPCKVIEGSYIWFSTKNVRQKMHKHIRDGSHLNCPHLSSSKMSFVH